MGGDHGCGVVIDGVKQALHSLNRISRLYLVGNEAEIQAALHRLHCRDPRIQVVHASEVLTMEDKPTAGLRKKKDCSIARAVELVKCGQAEAVVSPGNTGGILAASALKLRTLPGVDRPAIATVIPAPENRFVLLDAGANIGCKPVNLLHYAVMGHVYAREILGYARPRVGILSVGTEEGKGNELTLEAYKLCKKIDIHFVGNVEGHDLFRNRVEVVVCDGFVGNVVLKTCESLAKGLLTWLKAELARSLKRRIGALLAKNAFRDVLHRMDPDAYGGAPLLGLNGHVMKAHGSSRERAIMNAVRVTTEIIGHNINRHIQDQILAANEAIAAPAPAAAEVLA
jgi:glycerol-3-phosphate acyltransferase PlsX